jgi:hypothetical protein
MTENQMNENQEFESATVAELAEIREAYAGKINAAIGAGDDKLAIELSTQFRDEALEALADASSRRVA